MTLIQRRATVHASSQALHAFEHEALQLSRSHSMEGEEGRANISFGFEDLLCVLPRLSVHRRTVSCYEVPERHGPAPEADMSLVIVSAERSLRSMCP